MKGWLAGAAVLMVAAACGDAGGPPDATLPPGAEETESFVMPEAPASEDAPPSEAPQTEPAAVGTTG